jgi:hypothetical protein
MAQDKEVVTLPQRLPGTDGTGPSQIGTTICRPIFWNQTKSRISLDLAVSPFDRSHGPLRSSSKADTTVLQYHDQHQFHNNSYPLRVHSHECLLSCRHDSRTIGVLKVVMQRASAKISQTTWWRGFAYICFGYACFRMLFLESLAFVFWCRSCSMSSMNPCDVMRSARNTGTIVAARSFSLNQSIAQGFLLCPAYSKAFDLIKLHAVPYSPLKSSTRGASVFATECN